MLRIVVHGEKAQKAGPIHGPDFAADRADFNAAVEAEQRRFTGDGALNVMRVFFFNAGVGARPPGAIDEECEERSLVANPPEEIIDLALDIRGGYLRNHAPSGDLIELMNSHCQCNSDDDRTSKRTQFVAVAIKIAKL